MRLMRRSASYMRDLRMLNSRPEDRTCRRCLTWSFDLRVFNEKRADTLARAEDERVRSSFGFRTYSALQSAESERTREQGAQLRECECQEHAQPRLCPEEQIFAQRAIERLIRADEHVIRAHARDTHVTAGRNGRIPR